MRHRIAAFVQEGPLPFIGIVVGVAVIFRVALGALQPAAGDESTPELSALPETDPPAAIVPTPAPAVTTRATAAPTVEGLAGSPGAAPPPRSAPARRKHRSHGRR